jgi:hypothetical protein
MGLTCGYVWLKGEVGWEVAANIFVNEAIHLKCLDGWIERSSFFCLVEWMRVDGDQIY